MSPIPDSEKQYSRAFRKKNSIFDGSYAFIAKLEFFYNDTCTWLCFNIVVGNCRTENFKSCVYKDNERRINRYLSDML